MPSTCKWTVKQSGAGSDKPLIRDISIDEAKKWLATNDDIQLSDSSWRTELVLLYSGLPELDSRDHDSLVTGFVKALGVFPTTVYSAADTVLFQSHLPSDPVEQLSHDASTWRSYSVADNAFCICWTWDKSRRLTKGVIWCRSEDDRGLRQHEYVLSSLLKFSHLRSHPLLLGVIAVETVISEIIATVVDEENGLLDAQLRTGHHYFTNMGPGDPLESIDLSKMSKFICGVAINVSSSFLVLQRIVRMTDFFINDKFSSMAHNNELQESDRQVQEHLQIQKRCASGLLDRTESARHKANIIIQTLFTLMTQRDQNIGIQIATDSKTLAEKATRDSTSMKAIAAVTMCFLPGTFVASLFAMPMFDWNAPPNHSLSNRFWIYWAVTIPLTVVVIGVWFIWINFADSPRRLRPAHRLRKRLPP